MAGQWPSGHGNPYQGYPPQGQQYQYGPQQYPYPQYRPPQPYSHPQPGPYHHPHYQTPAAASNQSRPPQIAQPTPPTCYNCGSADHWAQHCPEPRREVPAGSLTQPSYARPNKRQKYNAPVITKYPVPQPDQQFGPHGYGGQFPSQPGHPQYSVPYGSPTPYGPPTPMPPYSQQPPQWVPSPQHQHHQNYQPTYARNTPYPQQPYPGPSSPAGNIPYATHYTGPMPQGIHNQANYRPIESPYQGGRFAPAPSDISASPDNNRMYSGSKELEQPRNENANHVGSSRRDSSDRSVSMQLQPITPGTQSTLGPTNDADDDLLPVLDIPDVPTYPGPNGETKPRPVGLALPADYYVFESVGGVLPSPTSEADGRIRSVFITENSLVTVHKKLIDCDMWEYSAEDPIFRTISEEDELGPTKEQTSDHDRQMSIEVDSSSEREDGEWTRDIPLEKKATRTYEVSSASASDPIIKDYTHESPPSYTRRDASPRPTHLNGSSIAHDLSEHSVPDKSNGAEDILGASGITRLLKPVRAPARPYSSPEAGRKRDFDYRDLSDGEQGNERKRQADDYSLKRKRHQPKVAAAYSRRW